MQYGIVRQPIMIATGTITILSICVLTMVMFRVTSSVSAQSIVTTPQTAPQNANFRAYLPVVASRRPPIKSRSGIHLGNRSGDWNSPINFLTRIRGNTDGDWPRAVVVISNQLYTINRSTLSRCDVTSASIRSAALFTYLTQAVHAGSLVIIRIYPSPGNFVDYANPGGNHVLRSDTTPAGGSYCNGKFEKFRAIDDIAAEMNKIYELNVSQYGWPAGSFYFEPANEPNIEWYYPGVVPSHDNSLAWSDLEAYFVALYAYSKNLNPNLKILTPPMSQGAYAEVYAFGTCQIRSVIGGGSGYDYMGQTYGSQNDGFSWHNYWRQAKEFWNNSNPVCPSSSTPVTSDHIFQYFPNWLRSTISISSGKFSFISEADLLSPCQNPPHSVTNKDTQAEATQESIWRFISEERGAAILTVWILTNQYADLADGSLTNCDSSDPDTGNREIAWHEAYRETDEREWFTTWWLRPELTAE